MEANYITSDDVRYQLSNLKQLTFEVTDVCNLNCKYCAYGEWYNDYDRRENKKMRLDTAILLIDYLASFWESSQNMSANRYVYISFYGGEPLLNMPFIESVVGYLEKKRFRCRSFIYNLTTNGLALQRYMDYLAEHQFDLLISLDGNEYNTSYRVTKQGTPAFHEILKNVDALRVAYPDYFEAKVNFNAVLHNRNSIEEIYNFFKSRYNKIPIIGELNNMGIRPDKIDTFRESYRNKNESMRQAENYEAIEQDMFIRSATVQSVSNFLYQYSGHVYHDYVDLLLGRREKRVPTGTCLPFGKKMFVTVNGKILPCERIGQQYAYGSVSESDVRLDFQAIADIYNGYLAKIDKQCEKCCNFQACVQCIFNLRDLDGNPVCHGFMNEQIFARYKARQMDFLRKHPDVYHRIMEEVIVE